MLSALLEKVLIFAQVSPCKQAPGQNAPNRGCRFIMRREFDAQHVQLWILCQVQEPTYMQVVDGDSFS